MDIFMKRDYISLELNTMIIIIKYFVLYNVYSHDIMNENGFYPVYYDCFLHDFNHVIL